MSKKGKHGITFLRGDDDMPAKLDDVATELYALARSGDEFTRVMLLDFETREMVFAGTPAEFVEMLLDGEDGGKLARSRLVMGDITKPDEEWCEMARADFMQRKGGSNS